VNEPFSVDLRSLVETPSVVHRVGFTLSTLFAAFLVGALATPWQQSVQGEGRVVATGPNDRAQVVESPLDGRVAVVHVREGSLVRTGDELLELVDVDPLFVERLDTERTLAKAREAAIAERVAVIETRIEAQRRAREVALSAAAARIDMAKERARQADQAVVVAEATAATAATNLPRTRTLAEKGLRSQRDLELATLEVERATADRARAEAAVQAARAETASFEAERTRTARDTEASIEDTRAALQAARAELAVARAEVTRVEGRVSRQSAQKVVAPRDGVVFRVHALAGGHLVRVGEPLVTIVPVTEERSVEVWIAGNDASLVEVGRRVRLQFEGWPAVQFVGWPGAARGTFGGVVATVDATDDGTGRFRVLVAPDKTDAPWPPSSILRQGVRARGFVLLDNVTVAYELWRRLNGFPPSRKVTS
jgi:multidrug efflux pump subunit AcrA (membrane-fusion protein)